MTIIAAVRKDNELWMMADSQTSWNDFVRSDVEGRSKIIKLDHALIGITGRALYNNALQFFLDVRPELKASRFESALDVSRFFSQFYGFLKEEYALGGAQVNDVGHIGHSAFLLATPEKMYCIYSDRSVAEYGNYAAVGSGGEVTMGIIHSLYELLDEPAEILERAYNSCCHFIPSCGGAMELLNVAAFLHEQASGPETATQPETEDPAGEPDDTLPKAFRNNGKSARRFLQRLHKGHSERGKEAVNA